MRKITVDVVDILYPLVKDSIQKMGWLGVDQETMDEHARDGAEKFGEDLVWSDKDFTIEQFNS